MDQREMTSSNIAVWLYGSFARGDIDELSDVDFLVIGDDRNIQVRFFPHSSRLSVIMAR